MRRWPLVAGALLGLVLVTRAAFVTISGAPSLEKDAGHYDDIAKNLAQGHGFAFSAGMQFSGEVDAEGSPRPTARRPPLFPILLSLLYRMGFGPGAMLWVQVLLAGATAWGVHELARRLGLGERGALLALAGYLLYPPFLTYVGLLGTETLFMFLLVAGVLWILRGLDGRRRRDFAAAGLLLGLATLTRPTTLLFPLALFPFLVWPRSRAPRGWLMLAVVFALVQAPWVIRNAATFGRFEPTFTSRGYNLFMGTYPPTRGLSNLPAERQPPELLASFAGKDEFEINRLYGEAAMRNMREHPAAVVKLVGAKAVLCWFNTRPERNMFLPTPRSLAGNGPLLVLAVAGVVLLARRRAPHLWVPLAVIAYLVAMHLASVATVRYNLPSMPFVVLFAAAAADRTLAVLVPRWGTIPGPPSPATIDREEPRAST